MFDVFVCIVSMYIKFSVIADCYKTSFDIFRFDLIKLVFLSVVCIDNVCCSALTVVLGERIQVN